MTKFRLLLLFIVLPLSTAAQAQDACETDAGLNFVCGATNPEDLVQIPNTGLIISSGMAAGSGLYLIDANTNSLSTLTFSVQHNAEQFPACAEAPALESLNTHGLNIRAMPNGKSRLHVVGHVGREAIEVFEVDTDMSAPALTWIGCVLMPEGLEANSVASFADGSLLATVLFMPGTTFADAVVDRKNTGAVYEWSPGESGFTFIENSELPANNGIEVSADGSEFFVVSSGLQNVIAYSNNNPTEQLRTGAALPFTPDNVHMGPDGLLYTAGMANDVPECGGAPGPDHDIATLSVCPRGTIAVAIDPDTMQHTVVLSTDASEKFSNATMVLPVNGEFWIGSFSSDRIARAKQNP